MAASAPLQLCKSSTFNFAGKFPAAVVGFEKRERMCVTAAASEYSQAPVVFPPVLSVSVGQLGGINCAQSLYPLHRVFTARHSLEKPVPDPTTGLGELAQAAHHISMWSPGNVSSREVCCDAAVSRLEPVSILDPLKVVSWHF